MWLLLGKTSRLYVCFTSFQLVLEIQRTAQGPTDFLDILRNRAGGKLEKKFVLKRAFTLNV